MCVSNGSASGQEWAAASGFPLMKAVSIYLRLNISLQRWMFLLLFFICSLFYVEAIRLSVQHANRANSFVQQPRRVQNDFLVFFSDNLLSSTCFTLLCSRFEQR